MLVKRQEFRKAMPHMEDSKKELIKKILLQNPLIDIGLLDKIVQEKGLTGRNISKTIDLEKILFKILRFKCQGETFNSQSAD